LVQEHAFSDNGTHFTLIELPGYGRHDLTDEEIFFGIADWLEKSYRRGLRLNQLLYFHRITGDRPSESDLKYLRMFKKLCGKTDYRNTILGLTCWDQEEDEIVEAREKAFKDTPEVWGDMIEEGMRIERVPLERQKCIDIFLGQAKSGAIVLDIQHEMVHKEKPACNTRAAKVMKSYESSQATRDVEKLEILTEQYRHEASVKKLRQKASVTTSEQEERFRELLAIQNADFDKLANQKEKGTMEQRDYAEVQNRRIACFEQQKLATISQEFSLKAERLELEREHANRLADLDNAKVCRWSLAHKESIIAQEKLLLLEKYMGTKGSRQDFEFIRDKYRDPRDRTHHQGFCDYCLDQLSLFDSFWGKPTCVSSLHFYLSTREHG